MTSLLGLPLLVVLAQTPASGGTCAAHHATDVDQRGDQAMGFSHQETSHHFTLTPDGGRISAAALSTDDVTTRDAIRAHMGHIAQAFAAGNFEMPMFIHGKTPPGVPAMKRLRDRIHYRSEDTALGAQVVIRTADPNALAAIHAFLKFQIADHRTGDPTSVEK
jgi:hypothetical protein